MRIPGEAQPRQPEGKTGPLSDHPSHPGVDQDQAQGLISRNAARQRAGISLRHFDRLVKSGRTPKRIKLGTRVLFVEAQIDDWISKNCPPRPEWLRQRREDGRAPK